MYNFEIGDVVQITDKKWHSEKGVVVEKADGKYSLYIKKYGHCGLFTDSQLSIVSKVDYKEEKEK